MGIGQDQTKGFYEAKGMVRHMVILTEGHKEQLKQLAKLHGITQGEVVEVLLNNMEPAVLVPHFEAKRETKVKEKAPTKSDLLKKMTNLTAEQIAAIEAIVAK